MPASPATVTVPVAKVGQSPFTGGMIGSLVARAPAAPVEPPVPPRAPPVPTLAPPAPAFAPPVPADVPPAPAFAPPVPADIPPPSAPRLGGPPPAPPPPPFVELRLSQPAAQTIATTNRPRRGFIMADLLGTRTQQHPVHG